MDTLLRSTLILTALFALACGGAGASGTESQDETLGPTDETYTTAGDEEPMLEDEQEMSSDGDS